MATLTGFVRPTLSELIAQARAEYESKIPGADALLGQGVLPRLPEIDGQLAHSQHAHLDFIARQAHPLFAIDGDLDAWGRVFNVARKDAVQASGPVTFTGANGNEIEVDATVVRSDGVSYLVTEGGTVAGGTVTVFVQAEAAGLAGNADEGQVLSLASPIEGINTQGAAGDGGIVGGAEIEESGRPGVSEFYRARILERIALPPHGGNGNDYKTWALVVPGVTRAWVTSELGAGTVTVRFMMDDSYDDGIPQGDGAPDYTGDLADVHAYIESHEDPVTGEIVGRPVTADVFIVAPIAVPLNITVDGLSPDSADIRAAIAAELADMLRRRSSPGATIKRSWIWEAVSVAAGEDSHDITLPAADVTHDTGEIATLGIITYT